MAAFGKRLEAFEGKYFRDAEQSSMKKLVQKLVQEGKLPSEALQNIERKTAVTVGNAPSFASLPTIIQKGRPAAEQVYTYIKGVSPAPAPGPSGAFTLGTQVSMGRARWVVDNTSIFSVHDGKKMASTPAKPIDGYQAARMARIQAEAAMSPLVGGFRLLPEMTPGRALMWGTILAMWGTAAVTVATCRRMGIQKPEDVPVKVRESMQPYIDTLAAAFSPYKGQLQIPDLQAAQDTEMVRKLKSILH